jgi:hypothetical protein
MRKYFIPFLALIFFANDLQAQTAAKSIYAEIGGPGIASINYDMRFKPTEDGLGFRVGVGGFNIDGTSLLTVPVGLNYLLGKDQKNYFELGAGFTYINFKDGFSSEDDPFSSSFGHLSLGYRLQPKDGGFLFRANIVPIFGSGFFVPYYAGIAFGYKF